MAQTMAHHIRQADALRKSLNWQAATESYSLIQKMQPGNAVVTHNLALCHLALQNWDLAITCGRQALRDNPRQWQSALLLAKALNKNSQQDQALQLLDTLHQHLPANIDIRQELAHLQLHHLGDAAMAWQLVTPPGEQHTTGASTPTNLDARLIGLVSQLYDRAPAEPDKKSATQKPEKHCQLPAQRLKARDKATTESLNDAFLAFAPEHLQLPEQVQQSIRQLQHKNAIGHPKRHRIERPRIGLLSPQFFASPVYFFCIGALRHISQHADLIIFSRGHKQDWAAQEFQRIASQWHNVATLSAEKLALHITGQNLDSLIDLGGWMDPVALQALSCKLAPRQYKWVGGQSITTGLTSFDGFITDVHQTPTGSDSLYSEPLIRLQSGYVTYTPPPYMPAPQAPRTPATAGGLTLGITANPAKVSQAFLTDLAQRTHHWQHQRSAKIGLQFIDKRYQHPRVRQRIRQALPGLDLEFVTPASHRDYLSAIGQLDAIVDTFPYSGGLTTIEGLALGVPTLTRDGQLFCERHTLSHNAYANLNERSHHIDHWDSTQKPRRPGTLLPIDSARRNHKALGQELLQTLHPNTP